jgi:hypothetical protein
MIVAGISKTGIYEIEFRLRSSSAWFLSPYLAGPIEQAVALVARLNSSERWFFYRVVPALS